MVRPFVSLHQHHLADDNPHRTFYESVAAALDVHRGLRGPVSLPETMYRAVVYLGGGAYVLACRARDAKACDLRSLFAGFQALRAMKEQLADEEWKWGNRRPGERVLYERRSTATPFEAARIVAERVVTRFEALMWSWGPEVVAEAFPECMFDRATHRRGCAEVAAAFRRHFAPAVDFALPEHPAALFHAARDDIRDAVLSGAGDEEGLGVVVAEQDVNQGDEVPATRQDVPQTDEALPKPQPADVDARVRRLALVAAIVNEDPILSYDQIARKAGCVSATLYRDPQLRAVIDGVKNQRGAAVRGYRRDDGTVDAVEPETG